MGNTNAMAGRETRARGKGRKRPSRPVYLTVRRLADPATGEEIGALVPRYSCDQRAMRDRKYTVGSELRAELKKPRNPGFHRLAHAIGALVVDNIEAFAGLDAHAALKRLQREAGLFCDEQTIDIPGLGQLAVKVPQSIAFDELDEGSFHELVAGVCTHISTVYWNTLTPEQVEQMAQVMVTRD